MITTSITMMGLAPLNKSLKNAYSIINQTTIILFLILISIKLKKSRYKVKIGVNMEHHIHKIIYLTKLNLNNKLTRIRKTVITFSLNNLL